MNTQPTSKQLAYLRSLADTRQAPAPSGVFAWGSDLTGYLEAYPPTRAQVSKMIDWLRTLPVIERPAQPKASGEKLAPGAYRAADGTLYQVYPAREHEGMLAKEIIADETGVSFHYVGRADRFVTADQKLTLDEAAEFGQTFGVCCECGRLLTDPDSIAAGIGPVCAGRL